MSDGLIGVVVVYNPDRKLIINIKSYLDHLDQLIVIDNSDSSHNFTALDIHSDKINLIQKPQNIGIASALNIAAEIALKKGYNWMLTMDQDSAFMPGTFSAFAAIPGTIQYTDKVAVLGPEIHAEDEELPYETANILLEDAELLISSGSIINLAVWKEIGGFEDQLFIDEVDHDFCLKALRNSYKVRLVRGIHLSHNLGKSVFSSNKRDAVRKILHPPIRLYYIVRNGLYLIRKYASDFSEITRSRKKIIVITLKNNLYYGPSKLSQLMYIFKGLWHHWVGQYGKLK